MRAGWLASTTCSPDGWSRGRIAWFALRTWCASAFRAADVREPGADRTNVDHSRRDVSIQRSEHLMDLMIEHSSSGMSRVAGGMGAEEDPVCQERIAPARINGWLVAEHVDGHTTHAALSDCREQGIVIDEFGPGSVDEDGARSQLGEFSGPNDRRSVIRCGAMEADDIAAFEELFKGRRDVDAGLHPVRLIGKSRSPSDDSGSEPPGHRGDLLGDGAVTDKPQRGVAERSIEWARPVSFSRRSVTFGKMLQQGKNPGNGPFGNLLGMDVEGAIGDKDLSLSGRRDIDVVDAGSTFGDHQEVAGVVEDLVREPITICCHDRGAVSDQSGKMFNLGGLTLH